MRAYVGHGKSFFWEVNFIVSVFIFIVLYLLSATTFGMSFVLRIFSELPFSSHFHSHRFLNHVLNGLIYGRTFILGYSLLTSLSYWLRKEEHGFRIAFIIAVISEFVVSFITSYAALSFAEMPSYFVTLFLGSLFALFVILIYRAFKEREHIYQL